MKLFDSNQAQKAAKKMHQRFRFSGSLALALITAFAQCLNAQTPNPTSLVVTFLESPDHGLAVVLQAPGGKTFLIDTGHQSEKYNAGRDTIAPFLKVRGIQEIAGIVLSHPHSDHYGGASWLLDNYPVGELIDSGYDARGQSDAYRRLRQQAIDRGARYRSAVAGDKLSWDGALKVEVLSPPREFLSLAADPAKVSEHGLLNANSLVLRIQHGQNVFIFPGDAYGSGQAYLLGQYERQHLITTVLCAPHHGFNCSPEFAAVTRPEIVVASCLNHYENSSIPSPGIHAVKTFQPFNSQVYVTAWHGDVRVESDGTKCVVSTARAAVPPEAASAAGLKP